jgi:hypothetical protein
VLLVPALIWLCGFDPRTAAGTTLAVLVVPVVLPAAWRYHAARLVHVEAAVWIALAFAVGAYLGAYLVVQHMLPGQALRLGFGLIMIYIAIRLILAADSEATNVAAGIVATVIAWLSFLCLRLLGRRYPPPPDLAEKIQQMREKGRGEIDYHI